MLIVSKSTTAQLTLYGSVTVDGHEAAEAFIHIGGGCITFEGNLSKGFSVGPVDVLEPALAVNIHTSKSTETGRGFEVQFSGKVTVVYPHLTTETRTIPVRIELPNPDLALLPDMYGDVEIAAGDAPVLTVASSAVIDSGSRQVVLVDLGDGRYEPREVKLGRRGDNYVEVTDGVAEGDRVVSNGNFLIDAESNLQSALKAFTTSSASGARQ